MAIDFDKFHRVCFTTPVTPCELNMAISTTNGSDDDASEFVKEKSDNDTSLFEHVNHSDIKKAITADDVKLLRDCNDVSKLFAKRKQPNAKLVNKTKQFDARNLSERNIKVRKYAKEMFNRDAIKMSSRYMHKRAMFTVSTKDDDFADVASHPNRYFDDIIYGSSTSEIAENEVIDDFEDISDID